MRTCECTIASDSFPAQHEKNQSADGALTPLALLLASAEPEVDVSVVQERETQQDGQQIEEVIIP